MVDISNSITAYMVQKANDNAGWILDNIYPIMTLAQNMTAICWHLQPL